MLEVIKEFQAFMEGVDDKFCCEDCEMVEDCMNLYKAKKLMVELTAYEAEDFMCMPKEALDEVVKLNDALQECAWQRCDCRSRY